MCGAGRAATDRLQGLPVHRAQRIARDVQAVAPRRSLRLGPPRALVILLVCVVMLPPRRRDDRVCVRRRAARLPVPAPRLSFAYKALNNTDTLHINTK